MSNVNLILSCLIAMAGMLVIFLLIMGITALFQYLVANISWTLFWTLFLSAMTFFGIWVVVFKKMEEHS